MPDASCHADLGETLEEMSKNLELCEGVYQEESRYVSAHKETFRPEEDLKSGFQSRRRRVNVCRGNK
jgi:hypothetical protein